MLKQMLEQLKLILKLIQMEQMMLKLARLMLTQMLVQLMLMLELVEYFYFVKTILVLMLQLAVL